MDEKTVKTVSDKLDTVIRWLAAALICEKSQTEAIRQLGVLGMDRNLIADVTGAAATTVSVRLSEAKKKKKKGSKK